MTEPAFGQRVHAVAAGACIQHIGNQHRIVERHGVDPIAPHDQPVIFHVLRDLEDRSVFKHRLQGGQRLAQRNLPFNHAAAQQIARTGLVLKRNVSGSARRKRQRKADQFRLHRINGSGFRIESQEADFHRFGEPQLQCRDIANTGIGAGIDLLRTRRFRAFVGKRCRCVAGFRRGNGHRCRHGHDRHFAIRLWRDIHVRPVKVGSGRIGAPVGLHMARLHRGSIRIGRLGNTAR